MHVYSHLNLKKNKIINIPGLAVGESMDRDSLLPPALSESLHMPPPWPDVAQGRNGA